MTVDFALVQFVPFFFFWIMYKIDKFEGGWSGGAKVLCILCHCGIQGQLSVSGERMCTILVNHLECKCRLASRAQLFNALLA